MFIKSVNAKLLLNKISCYNYSHHSKIHVDKYKNRSDNQDKEKYFPHDTSIIKKDDEHKFDEVYTKGRGGCKYFNRDKEGIFDNFNVILNKTISASRPNTYELNRKNIDSIEFGSGSKKYDKYLHYGTQEALSKKKKEK